MTSDILMDDEVSGELASVIREVEWFLDIQLMEQPVSKGRFREARAAVIRELFLNAVMVDVMYS